MAETLPLFSTTEPLPIERTVRGTDPRTSLEAAINASRASKTAVAEVQSLMDDGRPRMDWEIHRDLRERFPRSLSTIQHGRLALTEAKLLIPAGVGKTPDGASSTIWKISGRTGL